jgi:hypothetical protein
MEGQMKKALGGLGVTTFMAFSLLAVPTYSQTHQPVRQNTTPRYDVAKEASTKATVEQVITKESKGPLSETHVLLATSKGTIDAPFGPFAMRGKNGISLTPGEAVTLVGETIQGPRGGSTYLVRTLEASSGKYTIRSKNGAYVIDPVKANDAPSTPTAHARSRSVR